MKKKLFSILLSLAMVVTMMPAMTMTAFATDTPINSLELAYSSLNYKTGEVVWTTTPANVKVDEYGDVFLCKNDELVYQLVIEGGQWIDWPATEEAGETITVEENELDYKKVNKAWIEFEIETDSGYIFTPQDTGFSLSVNENPITQFGDDEFEDDYSEGFTVHTQTSPIPGVVPNSSSIYLGLVIPLEETTSNWSLLAKAMKGEGSYENETTIKDGDTGLAKVKDTTEGEVKTRTITLLSDITATSTDSALVVSGDAKIVLDLNGHVLDRGLIGDDGTITNKNDGSAIYITNENKLTLEDSNPNISYKFKVLESGIWKYDGAWQDGDTETDTVKKVNGGVVTGGTGTQGFQYRIGGGVCEYNSGLFTMNGGNIIGNSSQYGGGVGIFPRTDIPRTQFGFIITNGRISGNLAIDGGGGILDCQSKTATFKAIDGDEIVITDNVSNFIGGGCNFYNSNDDLQMEGKIIIKDNLAKASGDAHVLHNLCVDSNPIKITGPLTGSEIYIAHCDYANDVINTGVLTSGFTTNNPGAKLNDFFHYDGPNTYYMDLNTEGEHAGELEVKAVPENYYLIDIKKSEHGSVSALRYAKTNDNVTLTVTPDSGYELDTLTYTPSGDAAIAISADAHGDYKFTMPGKAVTVMATFKESTKPGPGPTPGPTPSKDEQKFTEYKTNELSKLDKLAEEVTSDSDKAIVATAKADLAALKYDSTKTLAENETSARSIAEAAFVHVDKVIQTKLKAYKNGKIKVSWKALTLKDSWKVDTYQVYRKVGKKGKYKLFRTVKLGKKKTVTYKNTKKLKKGKKYYYKVRGKVKLSDGTYAYTKWSNVKHIKCKKTRK